jgi:hypothetical protein
LRYILLGTAFGVVGFTLLVGGAFVFFLAGWPGVGMVLLSPVALKLSRVYWNRGESRKPGNYGAVRKE